MNLRSYIVAHFGTNADFARMMKVAPQTVQKWLNIKYCVFDGYLWKRMRPIEEPVGMTSTETSNAVQGVMLKLCGGGVTLSDVRDAADNIYKIMNGVESEQISTEKQSATTKD